MEQTPRPAAGLSLLIDAPLRAVAQFGYVGVFLFFVISGFCIHLQWARASSAGQVLAVDFRRFWARRFRRLYPPYLIALAIYLVLIALKTPIRWDSFFLWDILLHVLMLHNLSARTVYSINGVFWTLAIEEQLYLAYFLLLYLRRRWGWRFTLCCCLAARILWYILGEVVRRQGVNFVVTEAAASHWFTWGLGALGVEAAFGLVSLPWWCRQWIVGVGLLLLAVGLTFALPSISSGMVFAHAAGWLALHPLWGAGFFVIINWLVHRELAVHANAERLPRIVVGLAAIGLFSYSLYLTHELVVMESYVFIFLRLPPLVVALGLTTPACIVAAWVFFRYCEKPFLFPARRVLAADGRKSGEEPEGRAADFPT